MHKRMRDMVDEEKEKSLKDLLRQMHERMSNDGDKYASDGPASEEMEEVDDEASGVSKPIGEAEKEEMLGEHMEGPEASESEGDEMKDMISHFMKNKHRPKHGKGIGMMIKISQKSDSKPKKMKS